MTRAILRMVYSFFAITGYSVLGLLACFNTSSSAVNEAALIVMSNTSFSSFSISRSFFLFFSLRSLNSSESISFDLRIVSDDSIRLFIERFWPVSHRPAPPARTSVAVNSRAVVEAIDCHFFISFSFLIAVVSTGISL